MECFVLLCHVGEGPVPTALVYLLFMINYKPLPGPPIVVIKKPHFCSTTESVTVPEKFELTFDGIALPYLSHNGLVFFRNNFIIVTVPGK